MSKKAFFYIDDVIWFLRDLTKESPASLFDNPFIKMLKEGYDKYGMKTQLNLFYRTDPETDFIAKPGCDYEEFTLADVTDAYKDEFKTASDWLKFSFHAEKEMPNWQNVNIDYDVAFDLVSRIKKEVFRFAGEDSFSYSAVPHWLSSSKGVVKALKDGGFKIMDTTSGDKKTYDAQTTPMADDACYSAYINNTQSETGVFVWFVPDLYVPCGYNHLNNEQTEKTLYNDGKILDEETGMYFKHFGGGIINVNSMADIKEVTEKFTPLADKEFVGYVIHEQYFHKGYVAYQTDYADKILLAAKILHDSGHEFIFGQDLVD